jgi:DNA-binding IclR family transcriptional regulator
METGNVLTRGLTILECLSSSTTLAEIARRADLPKSTAYRILYELRSHGWVVQNPNQSYSAGWRWRSAKGEIPGIREITETMDGALTHLRDRTGWTANLVLFRGDWATCDGRAEGELSEYVKPEIGAPVLLGSSGSGLAILSTVPETQMLKIMQSENRKLPPGTAGTLPGLMATVRRTRKVGFALSQRPIQTTEGSMTMACFARAFGGHSASTSAVGAISVGKPIKAVNNTEFAYLSETLLTTERELSLMFA